MKSNQFTYKRNRGLSLIEMMVSMVLGLFLIGGLTTMYLGSKKTDKIRAAVSDIEENARLTLNTLRAAIQHAGYKSVDNIILDKPFQTPTDGVIQNKFCNDSKAMITNSDLTTPPLEFQGYTKDGDLGDRITVVYRADNPDRGPVTFDCMGGDYSNDRVRQLSCSTDQPNGGMLNTGQSKIYNGLYVKQSDKTLRCLGSRSAKGSQVLAENIENMQIRYGVTQTFGDIKKTTYKNATQVETNGEWESVTSVQIAILVASKREVLEQAEAHEFELLDEIVNISSTRKLYRTYSTTINLPNRSRREMQTVTRSSVEAS